MSALYFVDGHHDVPAIKDSVILFTGYTGTDLSEVRTRTSISVMDVAGFVALDDVPACDLVLRSGQILRFKFAKPDGDSFWDDYMRFTSRLELILGITATPPA